MNWRQFYKVRPGTDNGYDLHTNDRRSLVAIIAVAMASIGLIDSPRVAIAIMIPIMGVNESAIIVFIVPILLSPSKRKNNAPANPKMASIEITIHSDVSMLSRALVKAVTEGSA